MFCEHTWREWQMAGNWAGVRQILSEVCVPFSAPLIPKCYLEQTRLRFPYLSTLQLEYPRWPTRVWLMSASAIIHFLLKTLLLISLSKLGITCWTPLVSFPSQKLTSSVGSGMTELWTISSATSSADFLLCFDFFSFFLCFLLLEDWSLETGEDPFCRDWKQIVRFSF